MSNVSRLVFSVGLSFGKWGRVLTESSKFESRQATGRLSFRVDREGLVGRHVPPQWQTRRAWL